MSGYYGRLLSRLGVQDGTPPGAVLAAFLGLQRETHPDEGGSRADWLDVWWAYQAALVAGRYTADPAAWERAHPEPTTLLDWRAVALTEVHGWLDRALDGVAEGPEHTNLRPDEVLNERETLVAEWAEFLPESWDQGRIPWFAGPPAVLHVQEDLRALMQLPELSHLNAGATWQVVYRTKEKLHSGARVLGSVRPLSPAERRLWPEQPAPLFRLELDWNYFAAMGSWTGPRGYREARFRLLHHELGHCLLRKQKGKTHGHDMEEMGATVERYGALSVRQARLIDRAWNHPRTQMLLQHVEKDERTFLAPRGTDDEGPMVLIISPEAFKEDVRQLQDLVAEQSTEQPGEVDVGAAPWAAITVLLEGLAAVERPVQADHDQLKHARAIIRRWAPGLTS